MTVTCYRCGYKVDEQTILTIRGIANVTGEASLRDFHDNGVIWTAGDSWKEEVKCPKCEAFFTPDMLQLRQTLTYECEGPECSNRAAIENMIRLRDDTILCKDCADKMGINARTGGDIG